MWDAFIDGILEAIKLGADEKFQERREQAFQEFHRQRTQASRDEISEVTRLIKQIDSIIQKVSFKSRLMKLTELQQKMITDEVIHKFEDRRAQLVNEKSRLTRN